MLTLTRGASFSKGTLVAGDGGPRIGVGLISPDSVAADSLNDWLYIADTSQHRVRRVHLGLLCTETSPNASTIAGGAGGMERFARGYSGDGGPAREAQLNVPAAVSLFPGGGQLLISDTFNHRLRVVDTDSGIITLFAGTGRPSADGDGGPATLASLHNPTYTAISAGRAVFLSDKGNHRLRRIDASGVITTLAGDGNAASTGDGGPASLAQLSDPIGIALDAGGSIFIAEASSHRVRRIDAQTGIISTVAGRGPAVEPEPWYAGDGGPASLAQLHKPWGLALDSLGGLLIADSLNHRLRYVDLGSGVITTVAGTGEARHCGDGQLAVDASLNEPSGITVDAASGDLLFTQTGNPPKHLQVGDWQFYHRVRTIRNWVVGASASPSRGASPSATGSQPSRPPSPSAPRTATRSGVTAMRSASGSRSRAPTASGTPTGRLPAGLAEGPPPPPSALSAVVLPIGIAVGVLAGVLLLGRAAPRARAALRSARAPLAQGAQAEGGLAAVMHAVAFVAAFSPLLAGAGGARGGARGAEWGARSAAGGARNAGGGAPAGGRGAV